MSAGRVIVVGGGVAGCSAALEARAHGLEVVLIDEHPQPLSTLSLDTPYFYGSRLSPLLADASAVADRVLGNNALLLECLEADVEVLPNTCVWGSYVPGPNSRSRATAQLGLADAERSWLTSYDHLILAPGARDLVLSFPGWHLPGVLGAAGAQVLLGRYQAFSGACAVVLGTGNTGLHLAQALLDAGVEVAALVDVSASPRGDAERILALAGRGVRFISGYVVEAALGTQSVEAMRLRPVPGVNGTPLTLPCDTVCLAIGLVPNIEIASSMGCALEYAAERGGWVPRLEESFASSLPGVYVVGDGAGVSERMVLDPAVAAEQGRRAARRIADRAPADPSGAQRELPAPSANTNAPLRAGGARPSAAEEWLQALTATADPQVLVCQCEEVTRADLLAARAPKSVRSAAPMAREARSAPWGSVDLMKRLTRAGMGHCQGRRCREHVALLLAQASGVGPEQLLPGSYRAPLRPLPLDVLAPRIAEKEILPWPTWFHPVNEGEIG